MPLFSLAPLANSMRPLASYPYPLDLINPSAENLLVGWNNPNTNIWSSFTGPTPQGTLPEPNSGNRFFYAQRPVNSITSSTMTQYIDLPPITHKDVDAGKIRVMGSFYQSAEGTLTTCWLGLQAVLENGSNDNGGGASPTSDGGSNIWVQRTGYVILNPGTRKIGVFLIATWSGTNNAPACFDNISIWMEKYR